jgi:CheY-like chemotaxis protein
MAALSEFDLRQKGVGEERRFPSYSRETRVRQSLRYRAARVYMDDMGYEVLDAVDGPAALDVMAHHPSVDLLITDVIMQAG